MSTSTPAKSSLAASLASLPDAERAEALAGLSEADALALLYDWGFWARPEQSAPQGEWDTWLIHTGRGWGKTRTGAEWVREQAASGEVKLIGLVGATAADIRDTMVEGESGILACCPPWDMPLYEPSKRHRLTWKNGCMAIGYSADEPSRLRGPNFGAAWCDELAAWRFLQEAWDNLMFALRKGMRPKCVITTTPRPLKLLKEIMADPGTIITRGSLYDNADNLAESFKRRILRRYEGTRLGRQEISGELLDDVPGALWTRAMIEAARYPLDPQRPVAEQLPRLFRVVVAVDPAVTSGEESDDTGIIVAGVGYNEQHKLTGYVISDETCHESPDAWARRAVNLYREHGADRIVAEVNNGGDLVEATVRAVDPSVPYKAVRASRGKQVRAEPVSALYEQGRIKHIGSFPDLEDQLCNFVPYSSERSPDRLDALVWAITELMLQEQAPVRRTVRLVNRVTI